MLLLFFRQLVIPLVWMTKLQVRWPVNRWKKWLQVGVPDFSVGWKIGDHQRTYFQVSLLRWWRWRWPGNGDGNGDGDDDDNDCKKPTSWWVELSSWWQAKVVARTQITWRINHLAGTKHCKLKYVRQRCFSKWMIEQYKGTPNTFSLCSVDKTPTLTKKYALLAGWPHLSEGDWIGTIDNWNL